MSDEYPFIFSFPAVTADNAYTPQKRNTAPVVCVIAVKVLNDTSIEMQFLKR
ncbi:hypothetical protein WN51_00938 [Melipona quadrifasciata]|uniref:Uncharacterized protein n=1 Tax=Melipona quadrifasciata TaxID=166423 RepID=A0A0M8ZW02_9HYME|nr:hypothetical protein WN51_00938 [Melipona quadrifasciata]